MAEDNGIDKLIRSHIGAFVGYSPCKSPDTLEGQVEVPPEGIIKLDANENPYGCSPKVQQALADGTSYNIYPDAGQTELRKWLADYTGVGAEYIVAGNGSDQLIDLIVRLFVEPGDEVVNCPPSFQMYRFSTQLCGGSLVEVPRDDNFDIDIKAVKAAISKKTKITFVANPNKPTGTITPESDILELLDTGRPVVVDEAYYEFSGETAVPLLDKYKNLIVLRTFSKWAGLAGFRVGYGIFPLEIANLLLTIKPPYNVNAAALVAVRESLKDIDYLRSCVKAVITERGRLFTELEKLDFLKPFPSKANFILCAVLSGQAGELQQKLEKKGILVRYFNEPMLRNYIRISVGKPEHTDALIKALREIGG